MATFTSIIVTNNIPSNVSEIIAIAGGNEKTVKPYNQEYGTVDGGAKYCVANFDKGNCNYSEILIVQPHTVNTVSIGDSEPNMSQIHRELVKSGKAVIVKSKTPTTPYGDIFPTKIVVK